MKILQLLRDNAGREKRPANTVVRNGDEASLYIYDVIDSFWGVSALAVIDAIAAAGDAKTLNVYINSPGGDVFEGRAIMAALGRFNGKTVAHIDSLCASAATSIALACGEVRMSDGAFFMIHNASGLVWGDKTDMRETADLLEKVEGAIVNDYTAKTGKDEAQVRAWMDAETWFTAAEAKENGFVDVVTTADKKAKNTWNLAAFGKVPEALLCNESTSIASLSADETKFLDDMVPHHEMAIEMARGVLPNVTNDDVRELVQRIISSQAGEIALMETWLGDKPGAENKKKKPMKMQADPPPDPTPEPKNEPAPAGFFMSAANANRLRLSIA